MIFYISINTPITHISSFGRITLILTAFILTVNIKCFLLYMLAKLFSVYHSEKQLFVLNFRGLSFEFHIESKYEVKSFAPQV